MPEIQKKPELKQQHFEHSKQQVTKDGVKTEYQRDQMRSSETEVNSGRCPVSDQPASYTETAEQLDIVGGMIDRDNKEFDKKLDQNDKLANEKAAQIKKLEAEAAKAASEFNAMKLKDDKKSGKLQEKLKEQEEKTFRLAQQLAAEQSEQKRAEAIHAEEAQRKSEEARRQSEILANRRAADRDLAQKKMNDLQETEREMKAKAKELEAYQQQEIAELEVKQKSMKIDIETSRKSMDELKRRHNLQNQKLKEDQANLEKLRNEAKMAQDLANQHEKEIADLQSRLLELDEKANNERQRAGNLGSAAANLQQGVEAQKMQIAQGQEALKDRETFLQRKTEEKKEIEIFSKEQLQNEEIALKKAQKLAKNLETERRETQQDVSRLTAEEQEARKSAQHNETNIHVEQQPATLHVFEHKTYETTEPVITEATTETAESHLNECNKSLGEKLVDKVKNIF